MLAMSLAYFHLSYVIHRKSDATFGLADLNKYVFSKSGCPVTGMAIVSLGN